MRHDTVANNSDIVVHLAAALSAYKIVVQKVHRFLHYSGYGYNFGLRGKTLQPPSRYYGYALCISIISILERILCEIQ